MPWQRLVVDVALEVDPDTGRLAYRTVIVTVPRQSGKTALLLPVWLQRAVQWERSRIVWTMQSGRDAKEKWTDEHLPLIEASPLAAGLLSIRKQAGSEATLWRNGSIQSLMSTTRKSGHGRTVDLGVIDEAFAQVDDRLEQAVRYAMRTRPESQLWLVSTMGPDDGSADWFHGWADAGRRSVENGDGLICYFEWSAEDDADPGDPDTWLGCMPALGHTVTLDTIRAEYEAALATPDGLAGFRRAALNQRTSTARNPVISPEDWADCYDDDAKHGRRLVMAVDVAEDSSYAAIAVASTVAGKTVVELVRHGVGTAWLMREVRDLDRKWKPTAWIRNTGGPAGGLAPWSKWTDVAGSQFAGACAALLDAVKAGRITHVGQPELDSALDVAARRPVTDGWVWSRRGSSGDISPVVAVTLAAHGARHAPRNALGMVH